MKEHNTVAIKRWENNLLMTQHMNGENRMEEYGD